MPALKLIAQMQTILEFRQVRYPTDISGNELITYAVIQGSNILQIGSGEGKRLKTLMGNKGSHNKAPIIGLCHKIYPETPISFYICKYTPADTKNSKEERQLQTLFGTVSVDGKQEYKDVVQYLRSKMGLKENSIESILLDLMETHGDILNHSLNTASTAHIVEKLFNGYWKKSSKL